MGDLKLIFFLNFSLLLGTITSIAFYVLNNFTTELTNNFLFFYLILPQNMTFFFAIKFLMCIGFLILIRGGTPRYRYDYLTKLGWLKFLSLVITIFSLSLLFTFIY